MSDTSLVFNTVGRDRGVSQLLTRTAGQVRAANLASAASTVALGGAMASAGAHAIALASSAAGAAGAIWLMPAAIAGTVAAVAAARTVTFGLADAWKATGQAATGGGGSAAGAGRRVAQAQREVKTATDALADAERAELAVQAAVTRARKEEAERLDDLSRSVREARLDEGDAIDAVAEAERDLIRARQGGVPEDIAKAERAYERAKLTVEQVTDRVEDLAAEQEDGARKGIEGSDAVQAALERQRDAQRQVEQAAQRLADAQEAVRESSAGAASGGIDPAAEALARLSPAGREVILTLRALAPAWAGAARAGQQATFRNVAGDLRDLSGIYLPRVTTWLGRMGGSFNVAIRQSAGLLRTSAGVRDVERLLDNTAKTTDRLARAVRPVVNGLLQWVAVGSNFLPGLAGNVGTIATRFEQWSINARRSGDAQRWISTGLTALRQFGALAWNVVMSVKAVLGAGDNGGGTLDALVAGSAAMRQWLESAEGQERVGQVLSTLRSILTGLGQVIPVVAAHGDEFNDGLNLTGQVVSFAAGHLDTLAKLLPVIAAGYVISKTAQTAANIATVVALPIRVAEVAANWGMRAALQAQTQALIANTAVHRGATAAAAAETAATNGGILARARAVVGMAAQRVAMVATRAATLTWAAAQWVLNAAMTANPVGLIILAVIALIGIIVLIATKTTWFQTAWKVAWGAIKTAAAAVGDWFVNTLWKKWILGAYNGIVSGGARFLNWYLSLPGRLGRGLANVGRIILSPFRWGFNQIASFWNRTVGRLSFRAPSWIPGGIGGMGWSMPTLPLLARGGNITRGGAAIVGDGGEPEIVDLPTGARVTPLSQAGGGGVTTLRLESDGTPMADFLVEMLRAAVKVRGGNVQVVLGRSG
ncbi:hypothetical protein O7622_01255 [Micromonospora sp. WMMD1076]|uniref:hypothetical protein n=1 Tax=Micromonospora sp. WMMD1076 TaxID=3016103 RepID=UPI00249B4CBB|nr:hypothetical protein [Micromonospora sp. WMMD1076]WFF07258.1 hypothetical protein O7622_01255 [Micromonospora sp. WMMD1076]